MSMEYHERKVPLQVDYFTRFLLPRLLHHWRTRQRHCVYHCKRKRRRELVLPHKFNTIMSQLRAKKETHTIARRERPHRLLRKGHLLGVGLRRNRCKQYQRQSSIELPWPNLEPAHETVASQ
jgi:hypothetical protein